MADLENLLDNGPSIADLTEIIEYQRAEIQRLENVLKHYDWIETAKQRPTKEDGLVFSHHDVTGWHTIHWRTIAETPNNFPIWCRIRPKPRR